MRLYRSNDPIKEIILGMGAALRDSGDKRNPEDIYALFLERGYEPLDLAENFQSYFEYGQAAIKELES